MGFERVRVRKAAWSLLQIVLFSVLFIALQYLFVMWRTDPTMGGGSTLVTAVVSGLLLLRLLDRRPAAELGFALQPVAGRHFGLGLLIGVAGLLGAIGLLVMVGAVRYAGDAGSIGQWATGTLNMLLVLLIPAAAEEALFRGYPFQKLVEGFGTVLATVGASLLFALAHVHNPSVNGFALVNIFAAGVVLSVAFLLTRSLWFATAVHLGWNWSMAALLDLPVSGLELFDTPLYEPIDRGPAWLSGGAFGPEAGLAGLLGLMIVLGGVLWTTRKPGWLT